jgi:2-polyprenyl-6-methoxyphenol hydroxylase-like FAD-dependent oxidoreductase
MNGSMDAALVRSVLVVGAGPAGLALARLLQLRGVSVAVLERDESATARPQGGSLDLRPDSGRLAIRAAGLDAEFAALSREDAKAFALIDSTGTVVPDAGQETHEDAGPEIDRGDLRAMLLDAVLPGTVQWGSTVTAVVAAEDGRWRAELQGGVSVTADLIVGADGIGSKVRARLTSTKPRYVGRTMLAANLRRDLWRGSELDAMLGEGSIMFAGGDKTIFVQRCAHDLVLLYFSMAVPERWPSQAGIDIEQTDAVLAAVREAYRDWDPRLLAMLTELDDGFRSWPLSVMPPQHRWDARSGLTMIGDAAHVMPPFTGKGVNLALFDALRLSEALMDGVHASMADAIAAFESEMQERTEREITECLEVGRHFYGLDPALAR